MTLKGCSNCDINKIIFLYIKGLAYLLVFSHKWSTICCFELIAGKTGQTCWQIIWKQELFDLKLNLEHFENKNLIGRR